MSSLKDWSGRRTVGGADYFPPEGESLGAIKIRQRVRPLEPVTRVLHRSISLLAPVIDRPRIEENDELVTAEGEFASIVRLTGISKVDGQAVEYILGFVFGDDFYDRFDAYCTDARQFASFRMTTRDVVFAHRLSLGRERSRRFHYDQPPKWHGLARHLIAEWYPLDYPRHHARIDVAPVIPDLSTRGLLEPLVLSFGAYPALIFEPGPAEPERVTSTYGLSGTLRTQRGRYRDEAPRKRPTILQTVTFQDERFTYLLRLATTEATFAEDEKTFRALCSSARPIPHPLAREIDLWSAWNKPSGPTPART